MSVFFNGQELITPTAASAVNDSAMVNPNPNIGQTLVLVGASVGGAPNTPLSFGSAPAAQAVLLGGPLYDAVQRAFNPSDEIAAQPQNIVCVRVNPAVQATLVLKDASANPVINLSSTDYGAYTSQIKVKVEAASIAGLKLTTQYGAAYYSQDNVSRLPFTIQYSGTGAGVMAISNSTLTLTLNGAAPISVPLATYPTVQQLVDYLNTISGIAAAVTNGQGASATVNALDSVAAQDVKTAAYQVTAHLQAAIDWFNGQEGFVTATRVAGAGTLPALMGFTYLAGGSDGVITNTQWAAAFTTLQTVDALIVVPLSTDPSIAAMADAHAVYMTSVVRKRRHAICGTALGTTNAAAIAAAKALNSDRTALTFLGMYDYNSAGVLTLFPPPLVAAMLGGAFCAVGPGVALTGVALNFRGIERNLVNPTDTDALIQGGVLCIENDTDGYRVVQSISTWLTDSRYDKVELSTSIATDYTQTAVEQATKKYKGKGVSPITIGALAADVETCLRGLAVPAPNGPGVLVGDANSPAYKNIVVTGSGNVFQVQFQASPVVPGNYVLTTINIVPYSGTVSAS